MKKFVSFLLLVSFTVMPFSLVADNSATITYLQNQTQNSWVTQALAAANIDDLDISYIDANETALMQASKYLLAFAAMDSSDADTVNALIDTVNSYFNNNQLGEITQLNDDFWGLLALSSVSSTDNIEAIKNFIITNQNADGGWSWSTEGDSDTNDTAAAIMALLEANVAVSDAVIVDALNYLQAHQNADGGIGYSTDSESDGASTAWVITALNKAEINPGDWNIDGNTPNLFLESLLQEDGSYLWMPSDEQGSAFVTPYALQALLGSTYPVNHINLENNETPFGKSIRIEGLENTICLADNLEAGTVLDLLVVAAAVCNFEYLVEETAYGPYVASIGGIDAEGMSGWQYWVNWEGGAVSVDTYQLVDGDQVLWGYGGWPTYAVKVEANLQNENDVLIQAQYFNETWQNLTETEVLVGSETYTTDANGQVTVTLNEDGVYPIFVEQAAQYVRSNKEYITIGNGISQTVDLTVNVNNDNGGGDDQVSFSVSQSSIDFGDLEPGQIAENILQVTNTGQVGIYMEASILGDDVLTNYTTLEQVAWPDFNQNLSSGASE